MRRAARRRRGPGVARLGEDREPLPQVQAASAQGPERHDGVPRVRAGADGIARARLRRGGRGMSAEDLRLAAWAADACGWCTCRRRSRTARWASTVATSRCCCLPSREGRGREALGAARAARALLRAAARGLPARVGQVRNEDGVRMGRQAGMDELPRGRRMRVGYDEGARGR